MTVLSLFDGMSCGQIALRELHVVGVVEYDEAIAALHIQKACLIEHFKNFILNVRLCQAIGLNKDWEQILDEQFKDL